MAPRTPTQARDVLPGSLIFYRIGRDVRRNRVARVRRIDRDLYELTMADGGSLVAPGDSPIDVHSVHPDPTRSEPCDERHVDE